MKRLVLVAVLGLGLVACGTGKSGSGSGNSTSIVLHFNTRGGQGIYLQVTGPPDAVPIVVRTVQQSAFGGNLVAAPATHGREACARTARLVTYPETEPSLRELSGQSISFAIYAHHVRSTSWFPPRSLCQLFLVSVSSNGIIPILAAGETIRTTYSPFMEPTIHCPARRIPARIRHRYPDLPRGPCLGRQPDFVVVKPRGVQRLQRNAIVLFNQTGQEMQDADTMCEGEGGGATFRRLVGLPGETVREDDRGYIWIRSAGASTWTKLDDAYIPAEDRAAANDPRHDYVHPGNEWRVPADEYFVMSDKRDVCDSRTWGAVPAANIIGSVVDIIRDGKVMKPAGIPG